MKKTERPLLFLLILMSTSITGFANDDGAACAMAGCGIVVYILILAVSLAIPIVLIVVIIKFIRKDATSRGMPNADTIKWLGLLGLLGLVIYLLQRPDVVLMACPTCGTHAGRVSLVRNVEMRRKKFKLILLTAILVASLGFAWDILRLPTQQLTARVYIGSVHVYQAVGRPLLKGKVACRYRPTCSDYSIEAVQRYGTLRGLVLTYKRIRSCTSSVPFGTVDHVP